MRKYLPIVLLSMHALFGENHRVRATNETVTLGLFDLKKQPVVKMASGDTVSLETWNSCLHAMVFNKTTPEDVAHFYTVHDIQKRRGMHSLTGPVYVEGAEPGDVLEIHIMDIKLGNWGYNFLSPSAGIFTNFSKPRIMYFKYNNNKTTTEFAKGVCFHLRPFPGIVAVCPPLDWPNGWPVDLKTHMGQPVPGEFNSVPPGPFAGNLDQRDLQVGSVLFVPVFQKGGLIWTGDSHAMQSNGEIDVTALETSYESIKFKVFVRKDLHAAGVFDKKVRNGDDVLSWPIVETCTEWIIIGLHTDLMEAMRLAARNAINFLVRFQGFSPEESYQFLSMEGSFDIAEAVNTVKNVSVHIRKSLFKGARQIQTLCKPDALPFHPPDVDVNAKCCPQEGKIIE